MSEADSSTVGQVVDALLRGSGNEHMTLLLPEESASTATTATGAPQPPLLRKVSISAGHGHPLLNAIAHHDMERVRHLVCIACYGVHDSDIEFALHMNAPADLVALLREYVTAGDKEEAPTRPSPRLMHETSASAAAGAGYYSPRSAHTTLATAIAEGDEQRVRHLVEVASFEITNHDVTSAILAGASPSLVALLESYAQPPERT